MSMTKAQMTTVIEDDIIDRDDKSTLVGYALDWAIEYIDKTAALRGFAFSELNREEITTTTISCTFATTDVNTTTDVITVSIDIPTGTKIVFTSTGTVPTGLTASTNYWAIRGSSTTITVAETHLEAWQGTAMDITAVGSGTHTVTAYRERLAKPDECRYIYSVRLIDGAESVKLQAMTPMRIDTIIPFGQQESPHRPTHYVEWKDWLQLYPIPDDTYVIVIRYFKWNAYDSVTTIPEIDHIDDIIIKAAAIHVWEILGEPEQANLMRQAVEVSLAKCGKLERMKPDLVLKPHMGSIAVSNEVSQSDPFIFSQG